MQGRRRRGRIREHHRHAEDRRRETHGPLVGGSGFGLPVVRLIRERVGAEDVTCLGRGEGDEVLAGLSDGRVCRVDPITLDLKEIARLPSEPRWVGQYARDGRSGILGVVEASKKVTQDGETWEAKYSVVHDLATGKTFTFEKKATTFLLDREGRLWLGGDKG